MSTETTNTSQTSRTFKKPGTEPWIHPGYPPLTCEIGSAAVEGQTIVYPKIARSRDLPAPPNQNFAALSYNLFSEPRKLSNGKFVYGFLRVAGCYSDFSLASNELSKLIREYDSKNPFRIASVGSWVPITEEDAFVKEKIDVKMQETERELRNRAEKEQASKQRQIQRELREREEELRSGKDLHEDKSSIEYYTMRRVTEFKLTEAKKRVQAQLQALEAKRYEVWTELKDLDTNHPDHSNNWLGVYNEKRKESGTSEWIPSKHEFEDYEQFLRDPDAYPKPEATDVQPQMFAV